MRRVGSRRSLGRHQTIRMNSLGRLASKFKSLWRSTPLPLEFISLPHSFHRFIVYSFTHLHTLWSHAKCIYGEFFSGFFLCFQKLIVISHFLFERINICNHHLRYSVESFISFFENFYSRNLGSMTSFGQMSFGETWWLWSGCCLCALFRFDFEQWKLYDSISDDGGDDDDDWQFHRC